MIQKFNYCNKTRLVIQCKYRASFYLEYKGMKRVPKRRSGLSEEIISKQVKKKK